MATTPSGIDWSDSDQPRIVMWQPGIDGPYTIPECRRLINQYARNRITTLLSNNHTDESTAIIKLRDAMAINRRIRGVRHNYDTDPTRQAA